MLSFTLQPIYLLGKISWYTMDKVLGGPQELILTLKSREKSFDAALA
jgi:hypothetical protein